MNSSLERGPGGPWSVKLSRILILRTIKKRMVKEINGRAIVPDKSDGYGHPAAAHGPGRA